MLENKGQPRNINFDVLRILACIFVVLAHVSSENIDTMSVETIDWRIAHIYNSVGHTGTILFLFISGALLLSENYDFKPKKFYTHNFLMLFTSYYAWIIIYHINGLISRGQYSGRHLKDVVINVIKGEASYHFWYVPMILGIYLILPMLRAICRAGRNVMVYFTALFLVVQVGFTTVKILDFPHKYLFVSVMDRIPFTLINHYAGYFIMGYLLMQELESREKNTRRRLLVGAALVIAGAVGGLFGDYVSTIQSGRNIISFNDLFSLTLCMSAVGVFMLVNTLTVSPNPKVRAMVAEGAKLSFAVYMLHPLIMGRILDITWLKSIPIILRIPLRTIIVFGISILIAWLLSLIPVIRQWVIFAGKRK